MAIIGKSSQRLLNRIFFDDTMPIGSPSLPDQIKFLVLSYFLHDGRMNLSDVSTQYQLLEQFFGAVKHNIPLSSMPLLTNACCAVILRMPSGGWTMIRRRMD